MPIYEYRCEKCGVFEATQRITEAPLANCPTCGSEVHRLISLTSFVLKGSGWYATDYARSNGKSESAGDSGGKDSTSNEGSADKGTSSSSDSAKSAVGESGKSASSDKSTSAKAAD